MKKTKNSLSNRMKSYEAVTDTSLMKKCPVVLRFDGVVFHTLTKGFNKPFDDLLMCTMQETMLDLCKNIQGAVFGYTQSDEKVLFREVIIAASNSIHLTNCFNALKKGEE